MPAQVNGCQSNPSNTAEIARATMRKAADTLAAESRKVFVLPWKVASWYASAGDRDRCLEWLERAYVDRDPNLICGYRVLTSCVAIRDFVT